MTVLWMVKVDEFDVMIDPVEFFGPIEMDQRVAWRGFNNNESVGPDVTEKQWPEFCKHRALAWNIVGTRPFRPMPRALRWSLSANPRPIGSIPSGIVDHEFLIVDPTNGDPDPKTAVYTGTDVGSVYEMRYFLRSVPDSHVTSSNPTNYDDDDFTLLSLLTYVSRADRWSLLLAPDDWNLSDVLPIVEVPTLCFSKVEAHPAGNSRQIIFQVDPDEVVDCGVTQVLPWEWDWPFGTSSQTVQVTPVPATQARIKVINPIIGPLNGFSQVEYHNSIPALHFRWVMRIDYDGLIDKHFVSVRVDEDMNNHMLDGGMIDTSGDIDVRMRQNGPLVRIDVFNDDVLKDTVVFIGDFTPCGNRFVFFQSNYDVPHMTNMALSTVQ